MDELLVTLFEAVANLNQQTKDLTEEINGFEDVYSKDKELLQKQLDDLTVQMDRLIKEAVNAMPKAKDGSDGKDGVDAEVDYDTIKEFIVSFIDTLPKPTNGKNGLSGIDGEDGVDGLDGANGKDGAKGDRGEIGKQGKKGDKGDKGDSVKGEDGLGIQDVHEKHGFIVVTLTDGTKREIKIPHKTTRVMSGAGVSDHTQLTNIGTKTHDELEQDLTALSNTVANLATASGSIYSNVEQAITDVEAVLDFELGIQSSNEAIFSFDAVNNTITFKKAGNYTFTSTMVFFSDTNSDVNLAFNLRDTTTNDILVTQGALLSLKKSETEIATLSTLVNVTAAMIEKTVDVNTVADIAGISILSFNSNLYSSAIDSGGTLSTARIEIEALYKIAHATAYKELTYSGSNITNIDIWTNSGKTVKLFSKVIGYNGSNITSTSITDEVNGGTLNKTINYSGSNISDTTTTYTA